MFSCEGSDRTTSISLLRDLNSVEPVNTFTATRSPLDWREREEERGREREGEGRRERRTERRGKERKIERRVRLSVLLCTTYMCVYFYHRNTLIYPSNYKRKRQGRDICTCTTVTLHCWPAHLVISDIHCASGTVAQPVSGAPHIVVWVAHLRIVVLVGHHLLLFRPVEVSTCTERGRVQLLSFIRQY